MIKTEEKLLRNLYRNAALADQYGGGRRGDRRRQLHFEELRRRGDLAGATNTYNRGGEPVVEGRAPRAHKSRNRLRRKRKSIKKRQELEKGAELSPSKQENPFKVHVSRGSSEFRIRPRSTMQHKNRRARPPRMDDKSSKSNSTEKSSLLGTRNYNRPKPPLFTDGGQRVAKGADSLSIYSEASSYSKRKKFRRLTTDKKSKGFRAPKKSNNYLLRANWGKKQSQFNQDTSFSSYKEVMEAFDSKPGNSHKRSNLDKMRRGMLIPGQMNDSLYVNDPSSIKGSHKNLDSSYSRISNISMISSRNEGSVHKRSRKYTIDSNGGDSVAEDPQNSPQIFDPKNHYVRPSGRNESTAEASFHSGKQKKNDFIVKLSKNKRKRPKKRMTFNTFLNPTKSNFANFKQKQAELNGNINFWEADNRLQEICNNLRTMCEDTPKHKKGLVHNLDSDDLEGQYKFFQAMDDGREFGGGFRGMAGNGVGGGDGGGGKDSGVKAAAFYSPMLVSRQFNKRRGHVLVRPSQYRTNNLDKF